jgi:hypothetical protein
VSPGCRPKPRPDHLPSELLIIPSILRTHTKLFTIFFAEEKAKFLLDLIVGIGKHRLIIQFYYY